jgi:hypothetical protein
MAKHIPVLPRCLFNQIADLESPLASAGGGTILSEDGTGYIAKHARINSKALALSKNKLKIVADIPPNLVY